VIHYRELLHQKPVLRSKRVEDRSGLEATDLYLMFMRGRTRGSDTEMTGAVFRTERKRMFRHNSFRCLHEDFAGQRFNDHHSLAD
jgi:hypothetical protein